MNNFKSFLSLVEEKIRLKCQYYNLNPELITIETTKNLIIITMPSTYPFVKHVWFKGKNKNVLDTIFELNEYLDEAIETVFIEPKNKNRITEEEYLEEFYESCQPEED